MMEHEDFMFRPVLRGMLRAESLTDGSVDLAFVALCNEAIDVEQENDMRMRSVVRAAEQSRR